MSTEEKTSPSADAGIAKSFEERLTFPKGKSWADDEDDDTPPPAPAEKKEAPAEKEEDVKAETDGANAFLNGSGLDEPEFDVNVKLADLQDNPNNPLYSVKDFSALELDPELLRALSVNGFHKPSKIQERALPLLMKNPPQNLIGQSQSGTGKTAAFTLNMLSRVDLNNQNPQCLVLAPTRELARQIASNCQMLGIFLEDKGLKIGEAIPKPEARGQQITGQIIVGTPGTVFDMIKRRQLDVRNVKVLTLDEADNMLDLQGMGDQCKRVKQQLPKTVQVVLFSATFPAEVLDFANIFAPNSNQITLEVEKLTVKGIKQMYLDCNDDEAKYAALLKFYSLMTIASVSAALIVSSKVAYADTLISPSSSSSVATPPQRSSAA